MDESKSAFAWTGRMFGGQKEEVRGKIKRSATNQMAETILLECTEGFPMRKE